MMTWSRFAEKIHQHLNKTNLLSRNDRLCVACSAGSDSVALAYVVYELQSAWNWSVVLGHIQHGFRPEADKRESDYCRKLAEKLGFDYLEERLSLGSDLKSAHGFEFYRKKYKLRKGQNLSEESLAREIRYAVFDKWMQNENCQALLTGHHAQDQAETVLYRFLTGSGPAGLSGIPEKRGYVRRPFLTIEKSDIETYCRDNEIKFFVDQSNFNEKYVRNRLRYSLMPYIRDLGFHDLEKNMLRFAGDMTAVKNIITERAESMFQKSFRDPDKGLEVPREFFHRNNDLFYRDLLKKILEELGLRSHAGRRELDQIAEFAKLAETGRQAEFRGLNVLIKREYALFRRNKAKYYKKKLLLKVGQTVDIPGFGRLNVSLISDLSVYKTATQGDAYISSTLYGKELIIRNWEAGDRIELFGSGGGKNVSDVLKDEKIPADKKQGYPVLTDGDEIIWIPGVKRSRKYCIEKNELEAIRLHLNNWRKE